MNIVFSSDKKEYNTIKKGTEILLAENDGFNQNIELSVKFQDRPEILINKRKDQILNGVKIIINVLTSVINDQKITVYTGNQNYSHRMVLVSFFAVTNQLQLQYRI